LRTALATTVTTLPHRQLARARSVFKIGYVLAALCVGRLKVVTRGVHQAACLHGVDLLLSLFFNPVRRHFLRRFGSVFFI
jgi:hypothetical protein